MPRYATLAERLRAHRHAFTLAMQLGCTPKEAEIELQRRAGLASIAAKRQQLAAMRAAPQPALQQERPEGRDPQPWMMRDLDK